MTKKERIQYAYQRFGTRKLHIIRKLNCGGKDGAVICRELFTYMRKHGEDIDDVEAFGTYGNHFCLWTLNRSYEVMLSGDRIYGIYSMERYPLAGCFRMFPQ